MEQQPQGALRVSLVPGVMPGKWTRVWQQRHPGTPVELVPVDEAEQLAGVREGSVQMAFVRGVAEHGGLHLIPLYVERTVVVLSRDHPWAEATELTLADLSEEHLLQSPETVPGWRDVAEEMRDGTRPTVPEMTPRQAVEVVAAGTGIVVLPMSVARLHHRKDVVAVPVVDLPEHPVGLVWPSGAEEADPRIDDFIGVVRGRTARSSRGRPETPEGASARRKPPERRRTPSPGQGRGRPSRRGGRRRS